MGIKEHRKQVRMMIRKLLAYPEYQKEKYSLWTSYWIITHNFTLLEDKFDLEILKSGKHFTHHIEIEDLSFAESIERANDYYKTNHPVRFSVETLDSVENVRIALKYYREKKIDIYRNLYLKLPALK